MPILRSTTAGTSQSAKQHGPPYATTYAIVGGTPTPSIDDPIAAVLLLLFLLSACAHLAILKINRARNLKFVFSGMLVALCLLRSVSLATRMVWASYPRDVNCMIAASVMTQCGSVLIFVINLFFAQRIVRAYHPRLGWSRAAGIAVWFLIVCVLCCLIMAIVSTIHSFFTLSKAQRQADRIVQLFAGSYLAFLAFLPMPVVALAAITHPRSDHVEKFGHGKWRAKIGLLMFTALVATLGAVFRVGVNFDGRPGTAPAWFHSRACYYSFNFVTDLIVSTAYLLARFDRRFIVPDGARGPGEYSPIIPPTHSNSTSNLESKLPLMGTHKPLVMLRQPAMPTTPPSPSSPPCTLTMTAKVPSTSSQRNLVEPVFKSTPGTEIPVRPTPQQSPKERSPRPNLHLTLKYHTQSNRSYATLQSHSPSNNIKDRPKSVQKSSSSDASPQRTAPKSRTRRAAMLRMRIHPSTLHSTSAITPLITTTPPTNSSFGSGELLVPNSSPSPTPGSKTSVKAPAAAHLVGPPILPALDLDSESLSATLPWVWDVRDSQGVARPGSRSSRGGGGATPTPTTTTTTTTTTTNISSSSYSSSRGGGSVTPESDSERKDTERSHSSTSTDETSGSNYSQDESAGENEKGKGKGKAVKVEAVRAKESSIGSGINSGNGSQRSMQSWRSRTM
ncbi:hypothetical protein F5B19DRAFT_265640 [Rostrohypoxylon terebratum]|nr:hypothetical protein F5B19DRAFT_265640 [Rostrohypoxylon terebratum]